MRRSPIDSRRPPIKAALLSTAALAILLAPVVASAGQPTKRVAKQATSTSLGKRILTTTKGRTLYSLSAETDGRFICTGSCLATWRPLLLPEGAKPKGPAKLGTTERPDGRSQVTFKGRPLYTFAGDTKAGDVNGEGIEDVGTWHAAAIAKLPPAPSQPPPQPEPPPYPYPSPS
jgi:predicted lipoprotein with Yx(FWY)xxD motif